MPPLAIHDPAEMRPEDWAEVVRELDTADAARERKVRRNEITETDLGVPLVVLRESKRRPKSDRSPYPAGPMHYDDKRWRFPNVIGMLGAWSHPVEGEPCGGCHDAVLSRGTICARCDRSGRDADIPKPTAVERARDNTRYDPPKGVKGGRT